MVGLDYIYQARITDVIDGEWPYLFISEEYQRGVYTRILGDVWCRSREEKLTEYLLDNFDVKY